MPITNLNRWKAYVSSEAFRASRRTAKLLAAGRVAHALAVVVHCDTTTMTRHEKRKHAEARDLVFAQWAHLLDDETIEFICCDKCVSTLMPKAASAIAEKHNGNDG
jgi:hypothetical protein